jgi:exodeoxyribonuclease VII large subunit
VNTPHRIYTVTELTRAIKSILENNFSLVWITGEVSNLSRPFSGHLYFSLKDRDAQISAVMFRSQGRNLKFEVKDGMTITGLGRLSIYEPRGSYQIILEYLEPAGAGALQIAFEQLKARLSAEGLFDSARKKPLPFLPGRIILVTSPSGAVVHDFIRIAGRRFPNLSIRILPVKVQGTGAEAEIADAIALANAWDDCDVLVLARGGGSLEDFHAFNSEIVARAVFSSKIPVVTGVGHETDYTIADFVADLRAPTPSAAAEIVVPLKSELARRCSEKSCALAAAIRHRVAHLRKELGNASERLVHPGKRIADFRLRVDDLTLRLIRSFRSDLGRRRERLSWRTARIAARGPADLIRKHKEKLQYLECNALNAFKNIMNRSRMRLLQSAAKMTALNPKAILERGYSITRVLPEKRIITDPRAVEIGRNVEVILSKGHLRCRVDGKIQND